MIFFERLESLEYKLIYFVRQFPRPTLPIINQYFVTNVHMMQNILAPRMINILIAMRRRGHFSSLSLLNTFFRFDLFPSSVSPWRRMFHKEINALRFRFLLRGEGFARCATQSVKCCLFLRSLLCCGREVIASWNMPSAPELDLDGYRHVRPSTKSTVCVNLEKSALRSNLRLLIFFYRIGWQMSHMAVRGAHMYCEFCFCIPEIL